MNDCKKCTVVYKAFDGTQFDTEEKCKVYNELPRVYVVTVSNRYTGNETKAFVCKQQADKYMGKFNTLPSVVYVGAMPIPNPHYGRCELKTYIVELPSDVKETVQEKITNKPSKKPWWSGLFGKDK